MEDQSKDARFVSVGWNGAGKEIRSFVPRETQVFCTVWTVMKWPRTIVKNRVRPNKTHAYMAPTGPGQSVAEPVGVSFRTRFGTVPTARPAAPWDSLKPKADPS